MRAAGVTGFVAMVVYTGSRGKEYKPKKCMKTQATVVTDPPFGELPVRPYFTYKIRFPERALCDGVEELKCEQVTLPVAVDATHHNGGSQGGGQGAGVRF